jgi:hypothetical protein
MQLIAYNTDLYTSLEEAQHAVKGLAVLSVLIEVRHMSVLIEVSHMSVLIEVCHMSVLIDVCYMSVLI